MSNDEEVLNRSIGRYERWDLACGAILILGLIVEFWDQGRYVGNFLVVIGVFGEILFSRWVGNASEAIRHRSEERVAEANARAEQAIAQAEKARLELARLQLTISPRVLTGEQIEKIHSLSGIVEEVFVASVGGIEPWQFAERIAVEMMKAGVKPGLLNPSSLTQSGLNIIFPAAVTDPERHPLYLALNNVGLSVTYCSRAQLYPGSFSHVRADVPIILVGEKPLPLRSTAGGASHDAQVAAATKT